MTETLNLTDQPKNSEYDKWSILREYTKDERERIDHSKGNLTYGEYDSRTQDSLTPEQTLQKYEQEKT